MAFTHKLSRRLAQAHFVSLSLIVAGCSDASAPSHDVAPPPTPASESSTSTSASGVVTTGSAAYPNEPSGFVKLTDRPFNGKIEAGWLDRGDPGFSIVQDPQAPQSPNSVGRAVYNIGHRGGTGPINTWYVLPVPRANLYVSFWVRFSQNWKGHPSTCNKILNFWIGGTNRVVLKGKAANMGTLHANLKLQSVNMKPSAYDIDANLSSSGIIRRAQWTRIEVVLRANTGGNKDGSIQWWVDGQPAGSYPGLSFVNASLGHTWTMVSWNPVWGGTGYVLDRVQDMQIDHVYISGS